MISISPYISSLISSKFEFESDHWDLGGFPHCDFKSQESNSNTCFCINVSYFLMIIMMGLECLFFGMSFFIMFFPLGTTLPIHEHILKSVSLYIAPRIREKGKIT